MDQKAVQMVKIPKRNFRPVGEQQCQGCAGDGKIIQEAADDLRGLDHIEGDQQNIDAAKVEG